MKVAEDRVEILCSPDSSGGGSPSAAAAATIEEPQPPQQQQPPQQAQPVPPSPGAIASPPSPPFIPLADLSDSVSHEVAARPKAARAAAFGAVASDNAADENVYAEERISSYLPWRPKKHARGPSRSSTPCFCVTIDGLVPEEEWQAPIPVATVKLSDLPDDASG